MTLAADRLTEPAPAPVPPRARGPAPGRVGEPSRPACSAGSSSGGSSPVGWFQRTSASAPTPGRPPGHLRLRYLELPSVSAVRSSSMVRSRSPGAAVGPHVDCTPSRRALAAYIAMSAQRAAPAPWRREPGRWRADAHPDVQPDVLHREGLQDQLAQRSASSAPGPARRRAGGRRTRRRPDGRGGRCRRTRRRRGPTWRSRWSPAWWPRLSLTSLKPSRSSRQRGRGADAVASTAWPPRAGRAGWAAR